MKRISVRDLRQKWPEAERALKIESELVITRDGEPVARIGLPAGARLGTDKGGAVGRASKMIG
jgi:antitoxin (DNA-binding transcriptional repressor) of toxin-antitoxin stability system